VKFCHRLADSMGNAAYEAQASVLVNEFNPHADGATVTVYGARKWLSGTAFPTQERLLILARWLNLSAHRLRFGEGNASDGIAAIAADMLPLQELVLLNDFRLLDSLSKQLVQELVRTLIKNRSRRTRVSRLIIDCESVFRDEGHPCRISPCRDTTRRVPAIRYKHRTPFRPARATPATTFGVESPSCTVRSALWRSV